MSDRLSTVLGDSSTSRFVLDRLSKASLSALCATCKELRKRVAPYLYSNFNLHSPRQAIPVVAAICNNQELGQHVRTFKTHSARSIQLSSNDEGKQLWRYIALAIARMPNLLSLQIDDIAGNVLHPDQEDTFDWILRDARDLESLRLFVYSFRWDTELDSFLARQRALRIIYAPACALDYEPSISENSLAENPWPELDFAEVALPLARRLCASPLRILVVHIRLERAVEDSASIVRDILPRLQDSQTLCVFGVRNMYRPSRWQVEILNAVNIVLPKARYYGTILLNPQNPTDIYTTLMKFPALEVLEVDFERFDPYPTHVGQRVIAYQLKTCCPTLCVVIAWLGSTHRAVWQYEESTATWQLNSGTQRMNGWEIAGYESSDSEVHV